MTNAVITAQQGSTQSDVGFKNRVINGDMRIDQRSNGAVVSGVTGGASYWLGDRFRIGGSALSTGRFSFQVVNDAPPGFIKSGKVTVTTSQTPTASDIQVLTQVIEGTNVADFMWGTSNAATASLSFWVKANISGQYVVAIRADNNSATYLASYTITSANAWQYITISIPGPTFGTWGGLTLSTTIGIRLDFNLGTGTTPSSASTNTWLAGDYFRTTSDVQLIQTLGATWQITGVQFEVGSSASGFDYRNYGTELAMCQRYFYRMYGLQYNFSQVNIGAGTFTFGTRTHPTTMRTTPTFGHNLTLASYVAALPTADQWATYYQNNGWPGISSGDFATVINDAGNSVYTALGGYSVTFGANTTAIRLGGNKYLEWSAEL
jgi:hypothetical protein